MEIFEIFNKKIPDSKKTTQDSYERGNCETDTDCEAGNSRG